MQSEAPREGFDGLFERAVVAVANADAEKVSLLGLTETEATFAVRRPFGAVRLTLLRYLDDAKERCRARVDELIKETKDIAFDLVLVGGRGAELRRWLKRPFAFRQPLGFVHVGDDGGVWTSKAKVAPGLLEGIVATHVDAETWSALAERAREGRAALAVDASELAAFGAAVRSRKPVVTWTLAGIILAVFGLEVAAGGSESLVVLSRLGALVPARINEGEYWRLISCTFLHAGWMHALLNTYVLYVLGCFLERIIGSMRFLIVYTVSALVGSVGSYVFLQATLSVGASGAVWGLLGAHAVLAYRDNGLLPKALIAGARRAAVINLGINVLNSFRPNVDMWAHFAGGAAGMALIFSGLLTKDLPRLGELEEARAADDPNALIDIPTAPGLRALSIFAGAMLALGLALGLVFGRPDQLMRAPTFERVSLPRLGVSLEVPAGLSQKPGASKDGAEVMFGAPLTDPMSVAIYTKEIAAELDAAAMEREVSLLLKDLPTPKNAKTVEPPKRLRHARGKGVVVRYVFPSKLDFERAFLLTPKLLVRVEVLRWPAFTGYAERGRVSKVLETLKLIPRR